MKQGRKRSISFLLAVVLLIGMFPVKAEASETEPTAFTEETTVTTEEIVIPTEESVVPTEASAEEPTEAPTEEPVVPAGETTAPTEATAAPTEEPTVPAEEPTFAPITPEEAGDDAAATIVYKVYVDATSFPDANFRNYILSQSYGADSRLTESELSQVTYLDVRNMGITSLGGIEYFTALKMLYCDQNQLTDLYLGQNTALTHVTCDYNQLTELNVSYNRALVSLHCNYNQLTSLEVNSGLVTLNCGGNQLTSLDLSANSDLENLYCSENQLSLLDLSYNDSLLTLYCSKNQLAALDLSSTRCNYVDADGNIRKIILNEQNQFDLTGLPGFDVTKASNWSGGTVSGNMLTATSETITYTYKLSDSFSETFTLQASLSSAYPAGSVLVNATNFPDGIFRDYILSQSFASDGLLTQEELASVTVLKPQSMDIQSLKGIEYFTELTTLWCNFNQLTELDVSKNTRLTTLGCNYNQLACLDLSKNINLTTLSSEGNNRKITLDALNQFDLSTLPGFDVSKASNWEGGTVNGNILKVTARYITYTYKMSDKYSQTFKLTADLPYTTVKVDETNFPDANFRAYILDQEYGKDGALTVDELLVVTRIEVPQMKIADLTGIEHFTSLTYLNCSYNQLTTLNVGNNPALTELYCSFNQLTELDVSKNQELTSMVCNHNLLKSLDMRQNGKLVMLECISNQLTMLDVSSNPVLTHLDCESNQLSTLDVSNNPELTNLNCNSNKLTSLDVRNNTALVDLACRWNQLAFLDVSGNYNILNLDCAANERNILVDPNNQYDLTSLSGFDVTRASNWSGGTIEGNILTATAGTITYTYQVNSYHFETFTLIAENYAPKTLKAPVISGSIDPETGKPVISWEEADCAVKYQVYRATSKNGKYTRLITTTKTSQLNANAVAGKLYYYKVRSVDANGKTSGYSNIVSKRCDLPQPSITVSGVSSSGKIKVSWKKIDGAKSYQVYRATSEDGEYTLMKTTTSTSYTNTSAKAGTTYYYKVRALHKTSAANSAYSEVKSRTCDLARPTVTLSSVASTGKIKVSWKAISGAVSYDIYRATGKSGTYSLLENVTGTSFTDSTAVAGKTYYYRVVAVHSNTAANSAKSTAKNRVCDLARPDVEIELKNKKPRLTWEKVEGATKYEVYRATSKNGKYTLVKTTTSTAYTNTGAKKGTTYYYKVKAIHKTSAANSAYSQVDSIKSK